MKMVMWGAMSNLGGLLETGVDGVEKVLGRAVKVYSRAMSEGTTQARCK